MVFVGTSCGVDFGLRVLALLTRSTPTSILIEVAGNILSVTVATGNGRGARAPDLRANFG